MSDYRFGDDYKLSIYPKEAMDCWGEIDIDKVEAVEIEWVDFIRKPDDKSRWFQLFGTPEQAAKTLSPDDMSCRWCLLHDHCKDECLIEEHGKLLEWLESEGGDD
jgi:hypothetical protein